MKKIFIISFQLLALSNLFGQSTVATLPFYESFDYALDQKLTPTGTAVDTTVPGQGLWVYGADVLSLDPIVVAQPWLNSKGLPECKGNAIRFKSGNDDPIILFPEQGEESGCIYASFLFRVNSWTTSSPTIFYQTWVYNGVEDYFFSFAKPNGSWPSVSHITSSNVFIKRDIKGDGFTIGIAESSFYPSPIVYYPQSFELGKDILIVIQYKYNQNEGTSSLWINPKVSAIEPLATVNTLIDKYDGGKLDGTPINGSLDKIRINKNSNSKTADITMDEIRVANTWQEVVGVSGLSHTISKIELSKLKPYLNEIVNGKLEISANDSSLKKVEIFDLSGKQLLSTETKAKTVAVPALAKGGYVLKIKENNKILDYRLTVK